MEEHRYKDICPNCEKEKNTISDYFCIKNRGRCERCMDKKRKAQNIKYRIKYVDM